MKRFALQKRTVMLVAALGPLLLLFIYVALSSGPLAPVAVVVEPVQRESLSPAVHGIGPVEARYTYNIGPTFPGRVKSLLVEVGESVEAGQLLGEMDPVDLDQRINAQDAALGRAKAQLAEAEARLVHSRSQFDRYEKLLESGSTNKESVDSRRQELAIAAAGLDAARQELARLRSEREALTAQRKNLELIAPVDGLVVSRDADPGTTLVAGQTAVQMIDPQFLWINARFDQLHAGGLADGLATRITLRSRSAESLSGSLLRIEPLADVVTEEILAKVVFRELPAPVPPVGELAEVTVQLAALPPGPVIPNAAIRRVDGQLGVWQVKAGELRFTPIRVTGSDLHGRVLVEEGLRPGDEVVVYSDSALTARSRIHRVEQLTVAAQ